MIKSAAQPEALMGWLGSLADPTRLRLLRLLERSELGVAELCDVLQMPQSTVSRHLKVLGDLGWADSRRQGTANYYRSTVDRLGPSARRLWVLAREVTDNWATVEQDQLRLEGCLKQRGTPAQAFFAGAAGQWDKLRAELYGGGVTRAAMGALLGSGWTVADLGCGTGEVSAELAGSVRRVIGVDQSPAMLKAARQRTERLGNVELRRGDLERLPIEDDTCDAAVVLLVLTYVANPSLVIAEAGRVLRGGGKLVVIDLLRHDRDDFRERMGQQSMGFDPVGLSNMLVEAGFEGARCCALPSEPGVKGPALVLASGELTGVGLEAGGRS